MTTVSDLIQNINSVDIEQETVRAIEQTDSSLVDKIKDQLLHGKDSSGLFISPKYTTEKYARKKNALNPKAGLFQPDLKLTGEFYKGITPFIYEESLLFGSSVEYADDLEERYSQRILAPDKYNLSEYAETKFLPELVEQIKDKTGMTTKQ